jgi:hypothetical protein
MTVVVMMIPKVIKKFLKMEFNCDIKKISEKLIYFSLVINILSILSEILSLTIGYETPSNVIIAKNIVSVVANLIFTVSTIVHSLYSIEDEIFNALPPKQRFLAEFFTRYKKTELKNKALNVIELLDRKKISSDHPYHDKYIDFKRMVRENLSGRIRLNGYLNIITFVFSYFNIIIFLVSYLEIVDLKGDSKKAMSFFIDIFNQILGLFFSYTAILCDNVSFLIDFTQRIHLLIDADIKTGIEIIEGNMEIEKYIYIVKHPIKALKRKATDLEKKLGNAPDAIVSIASISSLENSSRIKFSP